LAFDTTQSGLLQLYVFGGFLGEYAMDDSPLHIPLSQYNYRPLEGPDWIRIIQLHPSNSLTGTLKCDIVHADRSLLAWSREKHLNYYHAVSYVWGSGRTFSQDLHCDGSWTIKITPTMDTMLRRFRKSERSVNLWIDAISLNQLDKTEVSQQVQRMGEIYSQSRKVLVWMGNEEQDVAGVFPFFRSLGLAIFPPSSGRYGPSAMLLKIFSEYSMEPIQQFLHRPWFQRRWVLQELALSREARIYCGNEQISWKWLAMGFQKLVEYQVVLAECDLQLDDKAQTALRIANSLNDLSRDVLTNLWDFHECECSDSRDRIFALVAFSARTNPRDKRIKPSVKVDYSLNWEAVYVRFAAVCISSGHLDTLIEHAAAFGSLSRRDSSLPSWCPDWSKSRDIDQEKKRVAVSKFPNDALSRVLVEVSDDDKAIFIRISATAVYKSIGPWDRLLTWADVAHSMAALMPARTPFPHDDIAMLICSWVLEFHSTDARGNLYGTTSKSLINTAKWLALLLDSRSPTSRQGKVPTEMIDFIHGELLDRFLQLMKSHTFFMIPDFQLASKLASKRQYAFRLGFGPIDVSPGDVLLPLGGLLDPATRHENNISPLFKAAASSPSENSSGIDAAVLDSLLETYNLAAIPEVVIENDGTGEMQPLQLNPTSNWRAGKITTI
jgi:hypothetical protein